MNKKTWMNHYPNIMLWIGFFTGIWVSKGESIGFRLFSGIILAISAALLSFALMGASVEVDDRPNDYHKS